MREREHVHSHDPSPSSVDRLTTAGHAIAPETEEKTKKNVNPYNMLAIQFCTNTVCSSNDPPFECGPR